MAVVTYPLLSECNSDRLPDIELDRWRKSGMHWDVRRFALRAWSLGSLRLQSRVLDSSLSAARLEVQFHRCSSSFPSLTFCIYVGFRVVFVNCWIVRCSLIESPINWDLYWNDVIHASIALMSWWLRTSYLGLFTATAYLKVALSLVEVRKRWYVVKIYAGCLYGVYFMLSLMEYMHIPASS